MALTSRIRAWRERGRGEEFRGRRIHLKAPETLDLHGGYPYAG
jgi:hypothetical protein